MHSIFLSLLLLVTGLFAGSAAHANTQTALPSPASHDWITPAALRTVPAQAAPALAAFRKCPPHPALRAAAAGANTVVLAADDCGMPSQVSLDDRNEMIWPDTAPKALALAYLSPRNAVASRGSPTAWLRMLLRPPRT